jgi:hypothetical protein
VVPVRQKLQNLAKLHTEHLTGAASNLTHERREVQPPETQREIDELLVF